jgi:disulfide bond formation protein DsbB
MSIKSIIAGGPVAILAAGGGIMWAQHELHYLLRPSVVETIAGIAAVTGGVLWAKNKSKAQPAHSEAPPQQVTTNRQEPTAARRALPPAQSQVTDLYTVRQMHRMN